MPRLAVFCQTKRLCDKVAAALQDLGVDASAIHGDLPQVARERALRQFAEGKLAVLVATDVAARGLDIDDIGAVVHYDPPKDAKDYLHRSGRTARAGRDGWAVTLVEYNQHTQMRILQRTLRLPLEPPIEVFSNDVRLHDLDSFAAEAAAAPSTPRTTTRPSDRRTRVRSAASRRAARLGIAVSLAALAFVGGCGDDDDAGGGTLVPLDATPGGSAPTVASTGDIPMGAATTVDPALAGSGFVSIDVQLPTAGVDETIALDRATVSADQLDPVSLDATCTALDGATGRHGVGGRPAPARFGVPAGVGGDQHHRRPGRRQPRGDRRRQRRRSGDDVLRRHRRAGRRRPDRDVQRRRQRQHGHRRVRVRRGTRGHDDAPPAGGGEDVPESVPATPG